MFADPNDENTVYVLSARAFRSIDGGKTWERIYSGHGDYHDLWINPNNSKNMIMSDDVLELRKKWSGKIVLKGIMDKEDAKAALNIGADAIIVSNHGGRQLDGASSSVSALPKILDIVQDKCEIWVDGGIRTGQDILRLIALGAKGTLIGRAFLYGLGAEGEKGVTRILEILQKELDLTMALCGATDLSQVNKNILL